jgi:hypothetical protein
MVHDQAEPRRLQEVAGNPAQCEFVETGAWGCDEAAKGGFRMNTVGRLVVTGVAVATLAGCAGAATSPATSGPSQPMATAASSGSSEPPAAEDGVTVIDSGFGQSKKYVWVAALVKDAGQNTGQYVTANFNLKDASGEIIKSETHTEQLTWDGQELVVGTQVELDSSNVKVAAVEVDTSVSDHDDVETGRPQFTTGPVKIAKDDNGGYVASFDVLNPTAQKLTSLRIGVLCYDQAGEIMGGSDVYPELVPANGKIRGETSSLIATGKPTTCKAFPGGFDF